MTKIEVLEILAEAQKPISPDEVCKRLAGVSYRCSVYSYLFRLHSQGLLWRRNILGRVAYEISPRGIERLTFLKGKIYS